MKYIYRPLRILNKKKKPYIIYKDGRKVYIKGTDIKTIIKFINKNQKKIKQKKLNKETKKKIIKNVDRSLEDAIIKMTASAAQPIQLLKEQTELNNKINELKQENKLILKAIKEAEKEENKDNDIIIFKYNNIEYEIDKNKLGEFADKSYENYKLLKEYEKELKELKKEKEVDLENKQLDKNLKAIEDIKNKEIELENIKKELEEIENEKN